MTSPLSPHQQLLDSIALSPVPMVVSNPRRPDNPLEVANAAFCALTGYAENDILNRNCRFLRGEGTEPWVTEQIRAGISAQRPVLIEILNYRKDGSAFRNGVTIMPLFDAEGQLQWFLGSQVDLGEGDNRLALRRAQAAAKVKGLSRRQQEILGLMSRGQLNKQIAWQLGIAEKTVKMHRALMLERIGVATSAEGIRLAVEAGL